MNIDSVIIGFSPNEERIQFHICDQSIILLRKMCLVFLNTSHVDSLDIFSKEVINKVMDSIKTGIEEITVMKLNSS